MIGDRTTPSGVDGPELATPGRSAVEQFSARHEALRSAALDRYRAWLPAEPPGPGQQYAFEVDLDACTGCKACVTACHNMNGLDPGETWRTVGLLLGSSSAGPLQQSVTSSCHHCEDPGCLNGCPVLAYEKDPLTGIVRHLDDQCIGCQYCVLKCPYDAPKYNAELGIVRKCDLCVDRLRADEAPACVQGCPNGAIAVRVIDVGAPIVEPLLPLDTAAMLPADYTRPTTRYHTKRRARFERAGSFGAPRPAPAHTPLSVMMILTQLAVGGLGFGLWIPAGSGDVAELQQRWLVTLATSIGLLGLAASVLHLGRPLGAWKAFLGWRTSWMSREVVVLGAFAQLAVLFAAAQWIEALRGARPWLGWAALGSGAAGVFCSAMIYTDTRRPFWKLSRTLPSFALSVLLLGSASWVLVAHGIAVLAGASPVDAATLSFVTLLCAALAALKLAAELRFLHVAAGTARTALARSAELLRGALRAPFRARCATAVAGAVLFVLSAAALPHASALALAPVSIAWLLLLASELTERWLFFTAEATAGMPEV